MSCKMISSASSSSSHSASTAQLKHAVITLEPLSPSEELKFASSSTPNYSSNRNYSTGPSVELHRQHRRRLLIHLFGWFVVIIIVLLIGYVTFYFIS